MRPGPGLVVMALAFISGARRGSTSISSKTLTSSPTSSSSSSSSILSSSPSSSSSITTTTTEKSAFKDLQTSVEIYSQTLTPESLDLGKEKKQDWQHIEKASTTTVSTPVLTNGLYLSGALNYYPAPELVLPVQLKLSLYLDSRSRSTRNLAFTPVSHTRRAYKNTKSKRKARSAIGGYNVKRVNNEFSIKGDRSRLIIDSEDISTSDVTSNSGSIDLKQEKANGLTVYFPVHSADTSRSFDADDIFALVAEDDLLSEESFDHLLKLTDDKIGYLHNGEDYSGTGSVVVEGTQNSGGRGGSENKFSHKDSDDDEYIFERKISEQQKGAKIKELINNEPVHAALLVAQQSNNQNSNREVEPLLNLSKFSSTHNEAKNFGPTTSDTISKPPSKHRSIIESKHPLARLNPWISACDLAQPGPITAPDLQYLSFPETVCEAGEKHNVSQYLSPTLPLQLR
uniref:Uncharacterized protein n=1 Tax=Glossina brevipalpis TaxID=37001 RepID=A0A1A9WK22_9MUSC